MAREDVQTPHWMDVPAAPGSELARMQAAQQSRIRISDLCAEIWRAVGVVMDRHPDQLTYEEVAVALCDAQRRTLGHLLNQPTPLAREDVPDGTG